MQPEEGCSPGVATRLSKRRSMDGSVPSTPPSSGKGKRRDAPSDYRGDVSRAPDSDAARGSSGVAHLEPADEEMRDRSPSDSRSVSSDDADAREDVAAVAREAAVDRKRRDDEEASVAFARLLQEQERAFYERRVSNAPPGRGGDDEEKDETDYACDDDDDVDALAANDSGALGGSPEDVFRVENANDTTNADTNAVVPGSGSDEDASLALARALMEEEQREWRHRMLALAGVGDPDDEADEGVDVDGMTYEELTELGEHIGVQSKGASEEAMATLRRFAYGDANSFFTRAEKQKDNDDDDECCAVCRAGFERDDRCLGLPRCGHAYHAECLEPWLAENKCCPLCKTEIEGEAEAAA